MAAIPNDPLDTGLPAPPPPPVSPYPVPGQVSSFEQEARDRWKKAIDALPKDVQTAYFKLPETTRYNIFYQWWTKYNEPDLATWDPFYTAIGVKPPSATKPDTSATTANNALSPEEQIRQALNDPTSFYYGDDPNYWIQRYYETGQDLNYWLGRIRTNAGGGHGTPGGAGTTYGGFRIGDSNYQRVAPFQAPGFGGYTFQGASPFTAAQFANPNAAPFAFGAYAAPQPFTPGLITPGGTGVAPQGQGTPAPNLLGMAGGGSGGGVAASPFGGQVPGFGNDAVAAYMSGRGLPGSSSRGLPGSSGSASAGSPLAQGGALRLNPATGEWETASRLYSGGTTQPSGGATTPERGMPGFPVYQSPAQVYTAPQSTVVPDWVTAPDRVVAPTVAAPDQISAQGVAPAPTIAPGTITAPTIASPGNLSASTVAAPSNIAAGRINAPNPFTFGIPVPDASSAGAPPDPGQFNYQALATPDAYSAASPFVAPTLDETNDPGYQFRLSEAQRALTNYASAQGVRGGDVIKALSDYASNYASSEYGNVYNRAYQQWLGEIQNQLSAYQTNLNATLAAQGQQFGQAQSAFQTNTTAQQNAYAQALALYNARLAAQAQGYGQAFNTASFNTATDVDVQARNVANQLAADQLNAQFGLTAGTFNAQQQQAADQYSLAQQLAIQEANANYSMGAQRENVANALTAATTNAQNALTAGTFNAQLGYNAQAANVQNALTAALANAQYNYGAQSTNAANQLQAGISNAQLSQSGQIANARNAFDAYQANVANALNAYLTNYNVAGGVYDRNFTQALQSYQANTAEAYRAAALNAANTNFNAQLGWDVAQGTYDRNYQSAWNAYQSEIQQNQYAAGMGYQWAGLGLQAQNQGYNQALNSYLAQLQAQQQQYNQQYQQQVLGLNATSGLNSSNDLFAQLLIGLLTGQGNVLGAGQIGGAGTYDFTNIPAYLLYGLSGNPNPFGGSHVAPGVGIV